MAKKRCTRLGKAQGAWGNDQTTHNINQLKEILFNNPNNKKFVITNFGYNLSDYQQFESEICAIDKVLAFALPNP